MSGLIMATRLWERTSQHGTVYLAGRLGGLRVVIMPRKSGDSDDSDHTHELLIGAPAVSPVISGNDGPRSARSRS